MLPASLDGDCLQCFERQETSLTAAAKESKSHSRTLVPVNKRYRDMKGDFHQTSKCGQALAPGASCDVKVVFKPTKIGTGSGGLKFSDHAAASPQSANLTGTGV